MRLELTDRAAGPVEDSRHALFDPRYPGLGFLGLGEVENVPPLSPSRRQHIESSLQGSRTSGERRRAGSLADAPSARGPCWLLCPCQRRARGIEAPSFIAGGATSSLNPARGWSGGGDTNHGSGSQLGADAVSGGKGAAGILEWLQTRFTDVTLASGTAGAGATSGEGFGGGAGLMINGGGPTGITGSGNEGGRGQEYGGASGGCGDAGATQIGNPGVVLIGVPG